MLQSVALLRGSKRGQLPPSLSKTVSEIHPDPLRFIFEGWGIPPRSRSSCGWSINFFSTASVRHLIVDGSVLKLLSKVVAGLPSEVAKLKLNPETHCSGVR
jgi:hypothetical protein